MPRPLRDLYFSAAMPASLFAGLIRCDISCRAAEARRGTGGALGDFPRGGDCAVHATGVSRRRPR